MTAKVKKMCITTGNRVLMRSTKIEVIGENENTYTIRFNLHYKDAEVCEIRNELSRLVKKDYGVLTDTVDKRFIEVLDSGSN